MEISEENKLDILLAQLQERYDALHKMRDRSMQFVLWIIGLGLGMAWLLINDTAISSLQQVAITVLLVLLNITTLYFVYAIECGFKKNRNITIRLETILKLYEKDFYGVNESILPAIFSHKKIRLTGHFKTLYAIIFVVFIFLIVITWTNPCTILKGDNPVPAEHNQIQKIINK